jgi:hypothetical protein
MNMSIKKLILVTVFGCLLSTNLVAQVLHLYGGEDHDVYLGCLNCNNYNANSVWNAYGEYGNRYNSNSIWNMYGTYGNEYSSNSPWNKYTPYPPIVVDKDGEFYGYFTINEYKSERADFQLALIMYQYHELIRDDVSKWYKKIFK